MRTEFSSHGFKFHSGQLSIATSNDPSLVNTIYINIIYIYIYIKYIFISEYKIFNRNTVTIIHQKPIMVAIVETIPTALCKTGALHQTLFTKQMCQTMQIMKRVYLGIS